MVQGKGGVGSGGLDTGKVPPGAQIPGPHNVWSLSRAHPSPQSICLHRVSILVKNLQAVYLLNESE